MDQMCFAQQHIERTRHTHKKTNNAKKRATAAAAAAVAAANINTYFHGQDGFSINYP